MAGSTTSTGSGPRASGDVGPPVLSDLISPRDAADRDQRSIHECAVSTGLMPPSVAGGPVDALPQEVRVAVVPRILLDHVDEHPAHRGGRLRARVGPLRVEVGALEDGIGGSDILLEPCEVVERAPCARVQQVLPLLGEEFLEVAPPAPLDPEPPPLAVGEVADQPEQAEP